MISTNQLINQASRSDWMMQDDLWRNTSEELLFPSDHSECEESESEDADSSPLPVLKSGVKRSHSTSISTSDLILRVLQLEETDQMDPSSTARGKFVNVGASEGAQQEVPTNEVLWTDGCEQQPTRARPAFLPTFSFSSLPTSFMGNADKPPTSSPISGDASESHWNKMFNDLLSPGMTTMQPEPEVAESSETRNINVSLPIWSTTGLLPMGSSNSFPLPTGNTLDPLLTKNTNAAVPALRKEEKPKPRKPRHDDIQTKREYIEKPTENDVILGRGGRSNHHKGNKVYRQLVEDTKMLYKTCRKDEKTKMSRSIVDRIQSEHHGRFICLDQVEKKWYVVSDSVARKKVSQALREINTPEFRAAKRQKYSRREETASL